MSQSHPLIPAPRELEVLDDGPFLFTPSTVVVADGGPEVVALAVLTADLIGRVAGWPVEVRYTSDGEPGAIVLRTVPGLDREAYRVESRAQRVVLEAGSADGLIHALATFQQLLRTEGESYLAPAVRVADAPRYGWRGLSLDVARHFFGVEDLKAVITLMTQYKLNVLHLHLSDDQGWRIDLPSRPELVGLSARTAVDGDPGGCYSAEDYAEIIAYAALRGIRVVPEIDVPGHVNAALHAYGELTPSGEPTEAYTGIDVGFSRLHADLPATAPFLRDVFGDLARMTPGEYLHVGGDEVLTMEPEEYARLVAMAADAVRSAGKQVVAWQEAAHVPIVSGTVLQYWDTRVDPQPFIDAARAGALLLMSPGSKSYLDMKYTADTVLGLDWAGYIELRDAYDWDPDTLIDGMPTEAVIGVEAAVWTETLRTRDELMSMLLPRIAAIAEVAWTTREQHGWDGFAQRVAQHAVAWDAVGLPWHESPGVDWSAAPEPGRWPRSDPGA